MFNRLKRELRINKHGVAVTKHVIAEPPPPRESLAAAYTVSTPAFSQEFVQQCEKLRADLLSELDPTSHDVNQDATKRVALHDYSKWTLEVLHTAFHGTGKLEQFMERGMLRDEDLVRAGVVFSEHDIYPNVPPEKVLDAVRQTAQRLLGLESLSDAEEGHESHELVSTMVRVATEASKLVEDRRSTRTQTSRGNFSSAYVRGANLPLMSDELAQVIIDYPDRGDDIIAHIKERCFEGDPLDTGFLRAHLDNPTSALADGVL